MEKKKLYFFIYKFYLHYLIISAIILFLTVV